MQGNKVSLNSNALATTQRLRSLLFTDIQNLTLNGNSELQVEANRDISMTVSQVGDLHLEASAFFGWQSELATLSITDTENVHIAWLAFQATSKFQRVRFSNITTLTLETGAIWGIIDKLELENIRSLRLDSGAIRATIGDLEISHVVSTWCPSQTISGSMGLVSLRSVTLPDVESRCLDASRGWRNLTITDSQLGHLSPRSLLGTIDSISISNCQILGAGPAAISVRATDLSMSSISVGYLSRWSLQVEDADSVTLRGITVTHLRQDALRGLQGVGSVSISGLTVRRADPGSLRFADGAQVTLTDLLLTGGCVCSTPSWAHQLLLGPHCGDEDGIYGNANTPLRGEECSFSGDGEGTFDGRSGGLAEERESLLQQIEAGLCTVDRGDSLSLADLTAWYCGESADSGGLGGEPTDSSPVLSGWWSYLGVILLTVLLLMLAALLVTAAVRYHRRRQKQQPDQEPEAIYDDVLYHLPEVAHPTDAGPPRTEECSCSAIGRYPMSSETRNCSCKPPGRSNNSETMYVSMAGGKMGTGPAGKIRHAPEQHVYSNNVVRKCIFLNPRLTGGGRLTPPLPNIRDSSKTKRKRTLNFYL